MVDTPVGVKCPSCAAPAPELLARQRAITMRALGIAIAMGAATAVVLRFIPFGFFMGLIAGFAITEVLRRYGSAGNLMQAGLVAAGTAWFGAGVLAEVMGFGFLTGIQIHAFEALIIAGVVWWRLR